MTDYVVDTVALVRYLEDRLPSQAEKAFRAGESGRSTLYLPQIVLAEFAFIAMRGRLPRLLRTADVQEVMANILGTDFIAVDGFPESAWDVLLRLDLPELHDRMIAAESVARAATLLTSDPAFETVDGLEVAWA